MAAAPLDRQCNHVILTPRETKKPIEWSYTSRLFLLPLLLVLIMTDN
mgnify:CR=1 FL=1